MESEVLEVAGTARTVEHTKRYRASLLPGGQRRVKTCLPAWLAPQVITEFGERRRVAGVAGMRRRNYAA